MQIRIAEIALAKFARPVRVLESLVNEQSMSPRCYKLARKVDKRMFGKIEIVEVHIERTLA